MKGIIVPLFMLCCFAGVPSYYPKNHIIGMSDATGIVTTVVPNLQHRGCKTKGFFIVKTKQGFWPMCGSSEVGKTMKILIPWPGI